MKLKNLLLALLCTFTITSVAQNTKYAGGDLSMLPKYEEAGVVYNDIYGSPITGDLLEYFRDKAGFNIVRVRIFVNPTGATGVCQDLNYVKALGKRIKDAGMAFLLDFHYSDTWADPQKQWKPSAWTSLTDQQLYTKIYDYTKECLQTLVDNGATPDFIQTGNEISYGMLWGAENSTTKKCYTSSDANWDYFRTLLTNAGKACREVCPNAKIIIHTERTGAWSTMKGIYDRLSSIDYDIIGLSYYPEWHNTIGTLTNNLSNLHNTYADKDIMIVETGYFNAYYSSDATYNFESTWPATPAGQKAFLDDLVAATKDLSYVIGLLYWFPEENQSAGNTVYSPWFNHGLFTTANGSATQALLTIQEFLGQQEENQDQDVTSSFQNMDFEDCTWNSGGWIDTCPGWTINYDMGWGSGKTWPVKVNQYHSTLTGGNYLYQAWAGSGTSLSAGNIIFQSASNMPAGTYTVSVAAHCECDVIALFANDDTQVIPYTANSSWSTATSVSVTTTLEEAGTLTVGLKLLSTPISTSEVNLYADNFKVTRVDTGVDNIIMDEAKTKDKPIKVLRNGMVLIEKNGRTYNAQGQIVK